MCASSYEFLSHCKHNLFWTYFFRKHLCTFFSSCKNHQKYSLLGNVELGKPLIFCGYEISSSHLQRFLSLSFSVHFIWIQGLTEVRNTLRFLIFFLIVLVWFMIRNKLLKERLIAFSINFFALKKIVCLPLCLQNSGS